MLIDTHAHINFKDYASEGEEVIKRALDKNIWMILPGSEFRTSRRALDYANKYQKGVYATVGLHPLHLHSMRAQAQISEAESYDFHTRGEDFNYDNYEKLAKFEKVVGIGEIGLDYYHIRLALNSGELRERQQEVFVEQLALARKLDMPVIIHCREAHNDMISILSDFKQENKSMFSDEPWGVMHCFSGDEDLAWKYFNLGLLISFTGLITFSKQWDDLIRKMPMDKLMVETDSPYMTPEPFRGQRNEPALVEYVAERIADIKKIDFEKVAEATTQNAKILFGI